MYRTFAAKSLCSLCKIIERYKKNDVFNMKYLSSKEQKKCMSFTTTDKKQAPSSIAEINT